MMKILRVGLGAIALSAGFLIITSACFCSALQAAVESAAQMLQVQKGLKPFEYTEAPAPLPNYVPNAAWGTQAEPIHTMQKPLEPSESMKHLATFPGFEASLFAAEPDVAKPIWMSWDERGRLWTAETFDYP